MADLVKVEVEGLKELESLLKKLPDRVALNALNSGMRAGARVIAKEARSLVPVRTGRLKKAITVRKKRKPGYFTAGAEGVPYAHLVEFGTVDWIGRPFLRPAFDNKKAEAIKAIKEKLGKNIETQAMKLGIETGALS